MKRPLDTWIVVLLLAPARVALSVGLIACRIAWDASELFLGDA